MSFSDIFENIVKLYICVGLGWVACIAFSCLYALIRELPAMFRKIYDDPMKYLIRSYKALSELALISLHFCLLASIAFAVIFLLILEPAPAFMIGGIVLLLLK